MTEIMWIVLLIFLLHVHMHVVKCDIKRNRTYVTTPLGTVQGYFEQSWKNRIYKSFTGIPFAQPPIGDLRFEPPVPLIKCTKTIEATSPAPLCPQFEENVIVGKEDCLYLNIYVPIVNRGETITLPVLVWIHGGAFKKGGSSKLKAKYLMDRDIILVTINYRLDAFGFLSTGDHVIPGNMGLKDQSLALRWVSENIEYFQGDPKQVTLGGDSAGGTSVHYHYLSPMSAGLFQNGISFSGSALNSWGLTGNSLLTVEYFANALECPANNTEIISICIKAKSMAKILQASNDVGKILAAYRLLFIPVLENVQSDYFINSTPEIIMKSGKLSDVPWIIGNVKDEGIIINSDLDVYTNDEAAAYVNENWETIGGDILMFQPNIPKTEWGRLVNLARKHYLGSEPISTDRDSLQKLARLIGDYLMSVKAQRAAKIQAAINKSPVRFYYYTYRAAESIIQVGPNKNITLGVSHGDDISFVFECNGMNPTTTANDRAMLEEVLDNWYSIVATRQPNLGVPWPDLGSSKDFQYMHIGGLGNNKMEINNNLAEIQFWSSIGL